MILDIILAIVIITLILTIAILIRVYQKPEYSAHKRGCACGNASGCNRRFDRDNRGRTGENRNRGCGCSGDR